MAAVWIATSFLTHWGRVTHICVSKLTIIGSDNGLLPGHLKQCWNAVNLDPWKQTSVKSQSQFKHFHSTKCIWKYRGKGEVRQVPTKGWARGVWCMKTNAFRTCDSHYELNISRLGCGFENIVWKMAAILSQPQCVNTLRLRLNCRHFPDDIFQWIFLNENIWILISFIEVCSYGSN